MLLFLVTRRLPDFKQRIGGQSLPFEDFAIHKAKKYFDKNGCLFLPGLVIIIIFILFSTFLDISEISLTLEIEINKMSIVPFYFQELIYIWNGFKVLNNRPDLVRPLTELVERSLHQLKLTKGKFPCTIPIN